MAITAGTLLMQYEIVVNAVNTTLSRITVDSTRVECYGNHVMNHQHAMIARNQPGSAIRGSRGVQACTSAGTAAKHGATVPVPVLRWSPWRRLGQRLRRWLDRYFPAREILFLGSGPITSQRFSQRRQVAIAMAVAIAVVWLTGASVDVVLSHRAASRMGRELRSLRATAQADAADRASFAQLSGELDWHRAHRRTAATETVALGSGLATLAWLLEHSDPPGREDELSARMFRAAVALAQVHARQVALSAALLPPQAQGTQAQGTQTQGTQIQRTQIQGTQIQGTQIQGSQILGRQSQGMPSPGPASALASLAPPVGDSADGPAGTPQLAVAGGPGWVPDWQPNQAPDWARQAQQRLTDQRAAIAQAAADHANLLAKGAQTETALARAAAALAAAVAERNQAVARSDAATAASRQAVAQLTELTRASIDEVEKIVASTGLDLSHLAPLRLPDRHDEPGQPRGGPLVPWRVPASGHAALPPDAGDALPDVGRLQAITRVLRQMPLSAPVGRVAVTSGFGYRLDPFTGNPSLHEGIDLEGVRGTPVFATAPGVVVLAGPRAEYGNMVEIDHGFGLMTRYGHLDRTLVQAGEHVALHQEIGLMGATGRATGVHLHYEVRVDGTAQNPASFMKVKNHVLQQN